MSISARVVGSIQQVNSDGCTARARASADIAVTARVSDAGVDGGRNGQARQSTGQTRPGVPHALAWRCVSRRLGTRQQTRQACRPLAAPRCADRSGAERAALKQHRAITFPDYAREAELHKSVAHFLDWALVPPAFFSTFPAGWGKLSKASAGRLYASGLKAGMPDIFVFGPGRKTVGIELKVPPNTATAVQRTMFAKLQAVGIRVYICRSIEDVVDALGQEGVPCRLGTNENGQLVGRATGRKETPQRDTFRPPT